MSTVTTRATDDVVTAEVEIAARPERVFRALTDASELAAWWASDGSEIRWEFERRAGARWRAIGRDDACGAFDMTGEVLELDPPRLLVMSWEERSSEHDLKRTVVRYELQPTAGGTLVRVLHSGFAVQPAARKDYQNGWPTVLGKLRGFLE